MQVALTERIDQAIELLEKANADLQPELLSAPAARRLLASYSRARRSVDFGIAGLSRKIDDVAAVADLTGTSKGQAHAVVATGKVMESSDDLSMALQQGAVSLEQATEIAKAEGAAKQLVPVAQREAFHVLKEKSRQVALEAQQNHGLGARQHAARSGRSYSDELGMVHIHLALEPHIGTPIVARAEAEAVRVARKAKAESVNEPFEHHLADAYASLLSGSGKGRSKRPELVCWSATRWQRAGGGTCGRARSARSRGSARFRPRWPRRSPSTHSSTACSTTARTFVSCGDGRAASPQRSLSRWS
jgi:hypothetical protein